MAASLKRVLAELNSIDVDQLATDERFFELADEIRNFHLETLPDAKRHWAQTGNYKALLKLYDNFHTRVSNEKEIEIAFVAGQFEFCRRFISREMLFMDEINLNGFNAESPIKDELKMMYEKFRNSDDLEEQFFADKVNRIFIHNNPHEIFWSNPHFERLEFSNFYKLWEQWRDEYDADLEKYAYPMRKQFLLRMKTLCRGNVLIEKCIADEAMIYEIDLEN